MTIRENQHHHARNRTAVQTGDKRKQRWRVIFLCMSLFFLALFCCLWNVLQIQGSFQILFHSMNMKYCITIYFHFLYIISMCYVGMMFYLCTHWWTLWYSACCNIFLFFNLCLIFITCCSEWPGFKTIKCKQTYNKYKNFNILHHFQQKYLKVECLNTLQLQTRYENYVLLTKPIWYYSSWNFHSSLFSIYGFVP